MGYGHINSSSYKKYMNSRGITSSSKVSDIYTNKKLVDRLNPYNVKYRESCDSEDNPNSTAIIIGEDLTGSMGYLAEEIAKNVLPDLIKEIYDKKPITDPHIMVMGINDAYSDYAPLEVTQFEADIRIAEQLMDLYFEGHGGGNGGESYLAAWYMAAFHTKIDCFEKRKIKGFLFTIGDEPNHELLTKDQIKRIFGDDVDHDYTSKELYELASEKYNIFHLIVGDYKYYNSDTKWKKEIGENAIVIDDYAKITETIINQMTNTKNIPDKDLKSENIEGDLVKF